LVVGEIQTRQKYSVLFVRCWKKQCVLSALVRMGRTGRMGRMGRRVSMSCKKRMGRMIRFITQPPQISVNPSDQ
jgi:hypothetical protein